jgi:hypothetical protein
MEGSPEHRHNSSRFSQIVAAISLAAMTALAGPAARAERTPISDQELKCRQESVKSATETCPPDLPKLYKDCFDAKVKEVLEGCMGDEQEQAPIN